MGRVSTARDHLCLALDVDDVDEAVRWVERTCRHFRTYKIGLELFSAAGPAAVDAVRRAGAEAIFVDLKLHDIPTTVARAVRALKGLSIDYLTVHVGGGRAMLEAAVEAAAGSLRLLGVTVLTSLDDEGLHELGFGGSVDAAVVARARLAIAAGLGGLVCSAADAAPVRAAVGTAPVLVTPGIRPAGEGRDDQRRIATPRAAREAGADLLVIGRAVTRARDWRAAVEALRAELD